MNPRNLKKRRSSTLCTPLCMPAPDTSPSRPCLESLDIPDHLIQQTEAPNFSTAKIQPRKSSLSNCSSCSCHKKDLPLFHQVGKIIKLRNCCRKSNVKMKKDDSKCWVQIQPPAPYCADDSSSKELNLPDSRNVSPTMSLASCMSISTSIDYQPSRSSQSQTEECCAVDLQSGPHIIKIQLMPPQNGTMSSTQLRNSCTTVSKESQTNMKKASNLSWSRTDQVYPPADAMPKSLAHISDNKQTSSKYNQTEASTGEGCCADGKRDETAEENNRKQSAVSESAAERISEPRPYSKLKIEMNQTHYTRPESTVAPSNMKRNSCPTCNRDVPGTTRRGSSYSAKPKMSCEFASPKNCECSLPPAYNEYGCTGNISGNCNCTSD